MCGLINAHDGIWLHLNSIKDVFPPLGISFHGFALLAGQHNREKRCGGVRKKGVTSVKQTDRGREHAHAFYATQCEIIFSQGSRNALPMTMMMMIIIKVSTVAKRDVK